MENQKEKEDIAKNYPNTQLLELSDREFKQP